MIKSLDMPLASLYSVARMFVQVTKCTHGKSTYLTYLVRESFRTPKGPRSRTVCNITALPETTRDLIAQSLRGQSFVATDQVGLTEAWSFGGLAVLRHRWDALDLDRLFGEVASARQAGLLNAQMNAQKLRPGPVEPQLPSGPAELAGGFRGAVAVVVFGNLFEDIHADELIGNFAGGWLAHAQGFGEFRPGSDSQLLQLAQEGAPVELAHPGGNVDHYLTKLRNVSIVKPRSGKTDESPAPPPVRCYGVAG